MHIFSDITSFLYQLNPEQRLRFNDFLQSLKNDGMTTLSYHAYSHNNVSIDSIMDKAIKITEWEEIRAGKELAASKGETTIPDDNWGVHETHCCLNHGCKYGDVDCPVTLDLIKQKYPCEICDDEEENAEFYRTYKHK